MNLEQQTLSGVNQITIPDALNASLLKLKITVTEATVIPNTNDLLIFVENRSTPSIERKNYVFHLQTPLSKQDEFILCPILINNQVHMKSFVKRTTNETELVEYASICLFAGTNVISTNYSNATIELIYPKQDNLNQFFLNQSIYYDMLKEMNWEESYLQNAFTKTEESLDLEVDHLNIACLTSKNDHFSLDKEGNLIVNSITTKQSTEENPDIWNFIYPIGSLYLSVNTIDPSQLFGGTWKQIKDCFLLASGDLYTNGETGGEASHTLTLDEMPSHTHTVRLNAGTAVGSYNNACKTNNYKDQYQANYVSPAGGSQAHNNMPPYLAIVVYQRIA